MDLDHTTVYGLLHCPIMEDGGGLAEQAVAAPLQLRG